MVVIFCLKMKSTRELIKLFTEEGAREKYLEVREGNGYGGERHCDCSMEGNDCVLRNGGGNGEKVSM